MRFALLLTTGVLVVSMVAGCGSTASSPPPAPTSAPFKAPASSPAASAAVSPSNKPEGTKTVPKTYSAPPQMTIDTKKSYVAVLHTNMGDIKIKLFASEVPATVNNFVFLARDGYYSGVKFHRVIKDFMIQSGDPTGTGAGTPGYRFNDEPITREYEAGTLAMANAGPNTNGSQFFITHADAKQLPKKYTIFGKVMDAASMDGVNKIATVPVKASQSGEPSAPTVDVHIDSVTIEEGPGS